MVVYFANPCTDAVRDAMTAGLLGFIDTPAQRNRRDAGFTWCADNGCFGAGYPGDLEYLGWLRGHVDDAASCRFATAPDVVGDALATIERSAPFLPLIRRIGYPAALVAQDGLENLTIPWDAFDALFIGGSTEWKLGPEARAIAREAKARNKWLHMGRVNSRVRCQYAQAIGCDSVDGTMLSYGPDANLPKLLRWVDEMNEQMTLEVTA